MRPRALLPTLPLATPAVAHVAASAARDAIGPPSPCAPPEASSKSSSTAALPPVYHRADVYSYADQMVADAWLALEDKQRERIAPCFASFDPTDLAAISHVQRMYYKYPKMWRGVGEVMCRHDDLTNMLLSKEVPRINHPALNAIYEFCIEVSLAILLQRGARPTQSYPTRERTPRHVHPSTCTHPCRMRCAWTCAGGVADPHPSQRGSGWRQ